MVRSGEQPRSAGRATQGTGPARLRERFLQGEPVEAGVRTPILNSWQRCRSLGLSPERADLPYTDDFDPDGRVVRAALPVLDRLQAAFSGSQVNISVADADGTVLLRRFGDPAMAGSLPPIQVVPGFVFAEQVAGTNGIGLALAERQLIHVYGAEHFAERSQQNACVALPVRDPLNGRIEGVLCFGYPRGFEHPALGVAIRQAAETIERRLLGQSSAHERALLRAYLSAGADASGACPGLAADALANAFHPREQAILMEKAAELISCGQRAAVDVTLPGGRQVTLVSHPMSDTSGVRGLAVEAVLPDSPAEPPLLLPHQTPPPPGSTTPPPFRPAVTSAADLLGGAERGRGAASRVRAAVEGAVGTGRDETARTGGAAAAAGAPHAADSAGADRGADVAGAAPDVTDGGPMARDGRRVAVEGGPAATVAADGAPPTPDSAPLPPGDTPPAADSTPPPAESTPPTPDNSRPTAGSTPPTPGDSPPTAENSPPTPNNTPPTPNNTPFAPYGTPPLAPDAGPLPSRGRAASPFPARGLLMVGEPHVGAYALAARRRLELLSEASARIGTTLDVRRTAEELAETAVPRLADFVTVDLPDAVLRGEESADPLADLRRTVVHGIREGLPFTAPGKRVDYAPTAPQLRCLTAGEAVLEPDLDAGAGWLARDPEGAARLLSHVRSVIAVPLLARGVVLGIASFYRAGSGFGDDDRSLARELATRAALSIDNARRYTHERAMVLALQRRLLPHGLPDQDAVEVAHRYLPAESDVGGDWYDVIPLSGARVGLLVGDVVGHGMLSAATMGRLRTAARSFAELDFPPDEVLTHLDNLVGRLDREDPDGQGVGVIGATCLYAVYDPAAQRCLMARAGHPPPALVRPDGTVTYPDLPAGPPLGLGGLPFDAVEVELPEGGQLVLYTDGLIEDRHRDVDEVLAGLTTALAHPERAPEETCRVILDTVAPAHPCDDIALLVARARALDPDRIATWDLLAEDPALVGEVRASALRRLADWGLEETAFAAELILSELITNAMRHGTGPIRVRLLYGRTLICEVSDASNTAPHLRRAASTDEGGRGLFLVAQLSQSWGTRYLPEGKVIWAECGLEAA
ncbi:SpoIIE family protein phosphatase [Streptomyces sp. bgisy032]|uniref:SpoIIE family protein phosphatase n=1 Tax=Streptomyces sp. bgisy032 TaxID=3413773 RepID=UPI003D71285C